MEAAVFKIEDEMAMAAAAKAYAHKSTLGGGKHKTGVPSGAKRAQGG